MRPELELPGQIVPFDRSEVDKTHRLPTVEGLAPARFEGGALLRRRCRAIARGCLVQRAGSGGQFGVTLSQRVMPDFAGCGRYPGGSAEGRGEEGGDAPVQITRRQTGA